MSRIGTEFFIARRISSQRNGKNNVMVRIAVLAVALGMAVMILSLSVVTGFKKEITEKMVGVGSHVVITSLYSTRSLETDPIRKNQTLEDAVSALPRFASISAYAVKGGMIKSPTAIHTLALKGIGPDYNTEFLKRHLICGEIPNVTDSVRSKEIMISEGVARLTGLDVGDRTEMLFVSTSRPVRRDRFKISGIYSTGMDETDNAIAYTDIRNIQKLNGWDSDMITGYEVMTTEFSTLDEFSQNVYAAVFDTADSTSDVLKVEDIVKLHPQVFDWLKAHNMNALVIIVIMLAVAFLNMTSAMLITLLEKTSLIGILKALGMRNSSVRKIFLFRSLKTVLTGMFWGDVVGLALAVIQRSTGVIKLNSAGYMLSQVPIDLSWKWFTELNIAVPVVMLILMVIPASAVSAIKPDRTMRYQ